MTDNIKQENGLTQFVEEIQKQELEVIEKLLLVAALKQEGLIDSLPHNYNLGPGVSTLIINTLAELLVSKLIKKKKRKEIIVEALGPLMQHIKPEIDKIYAAIKMVGFSSRIDATEENWRKAALDAFVDSQKGFQAIKKEHLEDEELYSFTPGKEKRDFEEKLLIKIIYSLDLGKYGERLLREIYKNSQ